jgi:geranylgeranyl diphosphate synthase type II
VDRPGIAAAGNPGRRGAESSAFEGRLAGYRDEAHRAVRASIPSGGPPHLYELVADYPERGGKGLRPALTLATCEALGGRRRDALNSAAAVELFHNAFLVHDDVQDDSHLRRGASTLHRAYGPAIAVNVGNATNLVALRRVLDNARLLGGTRGELIAAETERMMRHTIEGQALELAWIRDNVCDLTVRDYLRTCLKKTSWYSFVYPMRVGAIIAEGAQPPDRFCRFGWYVGAAFQIQDDILNLTGDAALYGKEIAGDLREGKRTLMLIRLLHTCRPRERRLLQRYLGAPPRERTPDRQAWVRDLMDRYRVVEEARRLARQLAGAAVLEALTALRDVPDSPARRFIVGLAEFVVRRRC